MIEKIGDYINSNLNKDVIIEYIQNTLVNFLEVEFIHVENINKFNSKSKITLQNLCKNPGELYYYNGYLNTRVKNTYYYVCLIKTKKEQDFIFSCGKKINNSIFIKEDLLLIKSVINFLIYILNRDELYKDLENYAENLEKEVANKTSELESQKSTLEGLLKIKEETLHIVNHQLNTPISIIKSAISMYQDKLWTEDKFIKVANVEINRVVQTVAQFLTANKVEDGKFELNRTKADFNTLIRTLIDEKTLLKKVRETKVKINFKERENLPPVYCDLEKMTEVVSNLLDNAINYSNKDIDVSLDFKDKNITLKVQDYGIGISKDSIKKLFERFSRLENAKATRPDGTGLGLYVCKQIVDAHKGKIWVESEGEGRGSVFYVTLPV